MATTPPRHPVEHLLRLLQSRMPWDSGKRVITQAGLHASRGWDDTVSAFRGAVLSPTALEKAHQVLRDAFVRHTYIGGKQVTWYDFRRWKADWVDALRAWFTKLPDGDLRVRFQIADWVPATTPYTQDALAPMLGGEPILIQVSKLESRLYIQFFSVRTYSTRETIDLSDWSEEDRAPFGSYSELIGVKRRNVPCFDSCVLDFAAGRLEIRVDFQQGFSSDEQAAAFHVVAEKLNDVVFRYVNLRPAGIGLVNYLPAVNKIYRDKTAGHVMMLGFVANSENTSSNNRGQTHRRRGQDLRTDAFHLGGKEKVKSLQPYAIGATWKSPFSQEQLIIELLGNVRMTYVPNPLIPVANFTGCTMVEDYDFLVKELSRQLP